MVRKLLSTNVPASGRLYVERALGGAALMLIHEVDALGGHWAEVRERLAVARKARGLGELVSCHTTATREKGAVKLASVGKKGIELLVITKLNMVFDVHDSESAAIQSFGS